MVLRKPRRPEIATSLTSLYFVQINCKNESNIIEPDFLLARIGSNPSSLRDIRLGKNRKHMVLSFFHPHTYFQLLRSLACPISVPQVFFPRGGKSLDASLCQSIQIFVELPELQYVCLLGPGEKDARRKIMNFGGTEEDGHEIIMESIIICG